MLACHAAPSEETPVHKLLEQIQQVKFYATEATPTNGVKQHQEMATTEHQHGLESKIGGTHSERRIQYII